MARRVTMFGDLERTTLPSGVEVYYRDSDHSYWRELKERRGGSYSGSGRLTGVSTVCGPFDFRPDSLLHWAEKLTLEGIVRGFNGESVPSDPYVLRGLLEQRGLRWEQIRNEAATRGTTVHKEMLHALATGETVPDLASLPEEHRGYGQAVMRWWLRNEPRVLQAEQVVADPDRGFAGRFDLRCEIRGEVVLVDAKTSGFIPTKAHAQLAGYDLGAITSGFGPSERWVILQLGADGEPHEISGQATHEDFLNGLAVYRGAGRISGAAKKARAA